MICLILVKNLMYMEFVFTKMSNLFSAQVKDMFVSHHTCCYNVVAAFGQATASYIYFLLFIFYMRSFRN